jgi:hypothetical protein
MTTDRGSRAIARWTAAVALFTLALVIVSGIADYFIYQQWSVALQAENSNREQLRAVVSAPGIVQINLPDKDNKPAGVGFITQFQNFGGTRTAAFSAWTSVHYFDGGVPNNFDPTKPYDKVDIPNSTVGPFGIMQLGAVTITNEEEDKAQKKVGVVILWGHADYSDLFEPRKNHAINYCYLLTPATATNGQAIFQASPYKGFCNNSP